MFTAVSSVHGVASDWAECQIYESGDAYEKYDVTALGELLIDFTENGKAVREIRFLKRTREGHLVMYLQCWRSWDIRQHLSGKWETISSENS